MFMKQVPVITYIISAILFLSLEGNKIKQTNKQTKI